MELTLEHAEAHLRNETPKEYVQGLATASEALRRARLAEKGGSAMTELDELRRMFEATPNG